MKTTITYQDKKGNIQSQYVKKNGNIFARSFKQNINQSHTNNSLTIIKDTELINAQRKFKGLDNFKKFKSWTNNQFEAIKSNFEYNKKVTRFLDRWTTLMAELRLVNSFNITFDPKNIQFEHYGFTTRIYIPDGYCYKDLENKIDILQNNLKCNILFKSYNNKDYIDAKFILLEDCNLIKFKPIPVKPYEFVIGVDESANPIKVNINEDVHILVAGNTGSGKNGTLDHGILSLINSCSEDEIEIYLFQGAKGDLIKYKKCKQVKCYYESYQIDEILNIFEKNIIGEMDRRKNLMKSMLENMDGTNIYDYNKKHNNKKLPYIYVIFDEFANFYEQAKKEKIKKGIIPPYSQVIGYLKSMGSYSRAYGITYIISHQKPEKELMPTFIKNQSNTRICYNVRDAICSQIVLDNDKAHNIPARKAYFEMNKREGYLYTMNLKDIKQYVTPHFRFKKNTFQKNKNNKSNFKSNRSQKSNVRERSESHLKNNIEMFKKENKVSTPPTIIEIKEEDIEIIYKDDKSKINKNKKVTLVESNFLNKKQPPGKERNDFSKVTPKSKEDILKENIKKIDGWVEYVPPKPRKGDHNDN